MNDKHISDDNQPAQQGIDDEDDKGMQKSMTDMHEENFGEDEMQKQNDDHTRPAQSNKGDPEEEASGNTDGGGRDVEELEMHLGEKLRNRNIQEMHEEDAKMQNSNDDHI